MQLTTTNFQQTMTSRDIAELTGKEHSHVLRDAQKMIEELGLPTMRYIQTWIHPQNKQEYPEYRLTKDLTLTLVAGYNVKMRHAIIKRWEELESKSKIALPDFSNPVAAARAWADEVEAKQLVQQQLAIAAPKAAFVDKYVESSSGSKGFRQVCKLLGAKEPEFRAFLHDEKIMYKLGGEWVPFSQHLDAGRFEVKAGTSDTTGHAFNAAKFTAKGVEWIAGEWAKHKIRGAE